MKASITLILFPMQSLLVRNGNELRRSLRRINSLTRRKLSPSNSSASASASASGAASRSGGGSCKVRKNSKVSIKSDDGGGQVQDSLVPQDLTAAALAV